MLQSIPVQPIRTTERGQESSHQLQRDCGLGVGARHRNYYHLVRRGGFDFGLERRRTTPPSGHGRGSVGRRLDYQSPLLNAATVLIQNELVHAAIRLLQEFGGHLGFQQVERFGGVPIELHRDRARRCILAAKSGLGRREERR